MSKPASTYNRKIKDVKGHLIALGWSVKTHPDLKVDVWTKNDTATIMDNKSGIPITCDIKQLPQVLKSIANLREDNLILMKYFIESEDIEETETALAIRKKKNIIEA